MSEPKGGSTEPPKAPLDPPQRGYPWDFTLIIWIVIWIIISFFRLQFANHIKKSEAGTKASKLRKVDLKISIDNVKIEDTKTKVGHHRMSTKDLDHAGCVWKML